MVLVEVYSKNLEDKYKTRLFSKTTLFAIILTITKILVPFFLAYRSKGKHPNLQLIIMANFFQLKVCG